MWNPGLKGRTLREIHGALQERLGAADLIDEYFAIAGDRESNNFPANARWVACYAVLGENEGHYIHVDAITADKRQTLFLGKTFRGRAHATAIAQTCAEFFEERWWEPIAFPEAHEDRLAIGESERSK